MSQECLSDMFTQECGYPMQFYIPFLLANRAALKMKIEQCGGNVLASEVGHHTICLCGEENISIARDRDVFDKKWVDDCILEKQILDLNPYRKNKCSNYRNMNIMDVLMGLKSWCDYTRIRVDEVSSSGFDSSTDEEHVLIGRQKRRRYTSSESSTVLDYICQKNRHFDINGNDVWRRMEKDHIMSPNRTWQSLRNHFLKTIVPSIEQYKLSEQDIRKFNVVFRKSGNRLQLPRFSKSLKCSNPEDSNHESDDSELSKSPDMSWDEDNCSMVNHSTLCKSKTVGSISLSRDNSCGVVVDKIAGECINEKNGETHENNGGLSAPEDIPQNVHAFNSEIVVSHSEKDGSQQDFVAQQENSQIPLMESEGCEPDEPLPLESSSSEDFPNLHLSTESLNCSDIKSPVVILEKRNYSPCYVDSPSGHISEYSDTASSSPSQIILKKKRIKRTNQKLLSVKRNLADCSDFYSESDESHFVESTSRRHRMLAKVVVKSEPVSESDDLPSVDADSTKGHGGAVLKRILRRHVKHYTSDEDVAIIHYIDKNRLYKEIGGNKIWKTLESNGTVPGRTWQSLKERFRKYIAFRIKDYNIPERCKARAVRNLEQYISKSGTDKSKMKMLMNLRPRRNKTTCQSNISKKSSVDNIIEDSHSSDSQIQKILPGLVHPLYQQDNNYLSTIAVGEESDSDCSITLPFNLGETQDRLNFEIFHNGNEENGTDNMMGAVESCENPVRDVAERNILENNDIVESNDKGGHVEYLASNKVVPADRGEHSSCNFPGTDRSINEVRTNSPGVVGLTATEVGSNKSVSQLKEEGITETALGESKATETTSSIIQSRRLCSHCTAPPKWMLSGDYLSSRYSSRMTRSSIATWTKLVKQHPHIHIKKLNKHK